MLAKFVWYRFVLLVFDLLCLNRSFALPTRIKNTKIVEPNSVYFQITKEIKGFYIKFGVNNVCIVFVYFVKIYCLQSPSFDPFGQPDPAAPVVAV